MKPLGLLVYALLLSPVVIFTWYRQRKMQALLDEPETEEEKMLRLALPPGLVQKPKDALFHELREDLKIADIYMETSIRTLADAQFWSAMDFFDLDGSDGGGGSIKHEKLHQLFNEMMEAQKHLTNAMHILHILGERREQGEILPFDSSLVAFGVFDWLVDHPFSDYLTIQKLRDLEPLLQQAFQQVRDLRARFV
ncbi:MAG: hypothetical protein H6728_10595 [Myxococcales bacterium]|nr:hypothetical protein [Myxococcales bacterium]MCB9643507.1 hypothetical protein [Myxococcales bacterium]